jgi:hypothetical protein
MTRPEEDVEIGATASPAVGALGATSDVFDVAVRNPRKNWIRIESSPSKKIASSSILQWEETTLQKGQEFSASVPKGDLTARAAKEDKNDTEITSPKIQKIDGANYKFDAIVTKRREGLCGCWTQRMLDAPWRKHTQCKPRRKELTELTVTKTHPICGLW